MKVNRQNPNCDGNKCMSPNGEVRVLPTSEMSNVILCCSCFNYEIEWRKDRNRDLAVFAKFDLPKWDDLKVYEPG